MTVPALRVWLSGTGLRRAQDVLRRRPRLLVYGLSTVAAVAWTIYAGKDLNWDALNYHLYAGFSALHDRFGIDYFAAEMQGYLNPYAHVPLYLMVMANWPSIAIGIAFACLHSINLWLCYELALVLNARNDGSTATGVGILAVLFAALNPVLLQEMGSSFTDISTGALVLAGWLALAQAFRQRRMSALAALGGAMLGVAAALKLSNALYAVAAVAIVALLPGRVHDRLRAAAAFSLSCGFAFLLAAGPWAWRLWQHLGNPLFPLFNTVFRSPDLTTEPLLDHRFLPASWSAALQRPFEMVLARPMIHTEVVAPDLRYAALIVLTAAAATVWLLHGRRRRPAAVGPPRPVALSRLPSVPDRVAVAVAAGFLAAWVLWLWMSGNSRYFLPMGSVAGVLLASLLARMFYARRSVMVGAAAGLLAVQLTLLASGMTLRWGHMEWQGPWYRVTVPERFRHQAYFYLELDPQSASFFLPFLAPRSGMMSLFDQYELGRGGPGDREVVEHLRGNAGRLRMLAQTQGGGALRAARPAEYFDPRLAAFRLKVNPADCTTFELYAAPSPIKIVRGGVPEWVESPPRHYLSCALVPLDPQTVLVYREQQARVDTVFDRVEDACPSLFQPRRAPTQEVGRTWQRHYANTDLELWIDDDIVMFRNSILHGKPIMIGGIRAWTRAPQLLDCRELQQRLASAPPPEPGG